MNLIAWIIVGLLAGFLARWIVGDDKTGCLYTIAVGVLGAFIGGALMNAAGERRDQRLRSAIDTCRRARRGVVAAGATSNRRAANAASSLAAEQLA